jgi:hypothetical protein
MKLLCATALGSLIRPFHASAATAILTTMIVDMTSAKQLFSREASQRAWAAFRPPPSPDLRGASQGLYSTRHAEL